MGLALLMLAVSPSGVELPPGWFTPVMAFEFAREPSDVAWLMDAPVREAMTQAQRIDMVFPFFYGALLFLIAQRQPQRWARIAGVFAIAAIPLDLIENLLMASVSTAIGAGVEPEHLAWLPTATWSKWLAIAASLGLLAAVHPSRVVRWSCGSAAVLSVSTWSYPTALTCEVMGVSVLFAFLVLVWRAFQPGAKSGARSSPFTV